MVAVLIVIRVLNDDDDDDDDDEVIMLIYLKRYCFSILPDYKKNHITVSQHVCTHCQNYSQLVSHPLVPESTMIHVSKFINHLYQNPL